MSDLSLEDQNFDNRQTELVGQIDNGNDYMGDIILQVRPAMFRDAPNHFPPFHAVIAIQGIGNAGTHPTGAVGVEGIGCESGSGGAGIGVRGIGANGGVGVVGQGNQRGSGVVGVISDNPVDPSALPTAGVFGSAAGSLAAAPGVHGDSEQGYGVFGTSRGGAKAAGVFGDCHQGPGVYGKSIEAAGVQGESTDQQGVVGSTDNGVGVWGLSTADAGVVGSSATSNGVVGIAPAGIGIFGKGLLSGVVGNPATPSGIGVEGSSESGIGVHGASTTGKAVFGSVPKSSPNAYAGYFQGRVFVDGPFTVNGAGNKHAAVPHPDGTMRLLYSLESPESWFEDFGHGRLVKGAIRIKIDPDFAAVVDTQRCHIFLTPYGDCNGLFVVERGATSFEVKEQRGGKSDVEFSYRLVAKPKNTEGERLAKFSLPADLPKPLIVEPTPHTRQPARTDIK